MSTLPSCTTSEHSDDIPLLLPLFATAPNGTDARAAEKLGAQFPPSLTSAALALFR